MALTTLPIAVVIPCRGMDAHRAQQSAVAAGAADVITIWDNDVAAKGPAVARNEGILQTLQNWIVCLDADDELLYGSLQALYEAWQPGTWVYGGWMEDKARIEAPPVGMLNRKPLCHATFLFHRNDWMRVGGFDFNFSLGIEDWAFQVALTTAGVQPIRIDYPVYQRRLGGERTAKAVKYYPLLHQVLRDKFPDFILEGGR